MINKGACLSLLVIALMPIPVLAEEQPAEQSVEGRGKSTLLEQRGASLLQGSPKEILRMREAIQDFSAAKNAPILHDFEPEVPQEVLDIDEMFEVTLGPDSKAPQVFISRFQGSAVSFVDAYGNPWPISKISSFMEGMILIDKALPDTPQAVGPGGDAEDGKTKAEDPLQNPQAGSFTITALKHGVVGNLTVYLHGLATPISIMLVGKPAMYHRTATVKIQDVGPQTNMSTLMAETGVVVGTETDMDLNHALYGVSPSGSEAMVVEGGEGKAWLKGSELFLQTPLAVFSPKIVRTSPGNGRYRAYRLPATTTVLATNNEGRTVQLRIKRHPSTDIYNKAGLQ